MTHIYGYNHVSCFVFNTLYIRYLYPNKELVDVWSVRNLFSLRRINEFDASVQHAAEIFGGSENLPVSHASCCRIWSSTQRCCKAFSKSKGSLFVSKMTRYWRSEIALMYRLRATANVCYPFSFYIFDVNESPAVFRFHCLAKSFCLATSRSDSASWITSRSHFKEAPCWGCCWASCLEKFNQYMAQCWWLAHWSQWHRVMIALPISILLLLLLWPPPSLLADCQRKAEGVVAVYHSWVCLWSAQRRVSQSSVSDSLTLKQP